MSKIRNCTDIRALEKRALKAGEAHIAEHLEAFRGEPPSDGSKKAIAMWKAFKKLHEAKHA